MLLLLLIQVVIVVGVLVVVVFVVVVVAAAAAVITALVTSCVRSLLQHATEEEIEERTELTERRGRRCKQIMDDPTGKERTLEIEKEALDCNLW